MADLETDLLGQIHTLSRLLWEGRVTGGDVEGWLKGFGPACAPNSEGRKHALYLLSRFLYFGRTQLRGLLQAIYRDHFRYPIIATFRRQHADTLDSTTIEAAFDLALSRTRFLGIGNPSESGTHLLYEYRQENGLSKDSFIHAHEIFNLASASPTLTDPSITRYIFIDDFCGSGVQASDYSQKLLHGMHSAATTASISIQVEYHVLIGTARGLDRVRTSAGFDRVACVLELDSSFRAFAPDSRYFRSAPQGIDRSLAESLSALYGSFLQQHWPLGFADGQLLLGFSHNTPDNTLPIFWHAGHAGQPWHPVFRRYQKH